MPTMSRAELATLGIVVDANGAIRSVDQLNAKLKTLGTMGEQAAAKVSQTAPPLRLVTSNASGAHASLGRLRQSLEAVTTQALGASPVLGKLGAVLGEMAYGGTIMTGVLLGTTALVAAYDQITKGARRAREEADKMTQSLVDQARAAQAATVAGAQNLQLIAEINLQNVKKESGVGFGSILTTLLRGGIPTTSGGDAEAQSKRIADARTAVEQAAVNVAKAQEAARGPLTGAAGGRIGDNSAQIARYNDLMARTYGTLGNRPAPYMLPPGELTQNAYNMALSDINGRIPNGAGAVGGIVAGMGFDAEGRSGFLDAGLKKSQLDVRDKMGILVNDGNKNAQKLHDAIWGSAAQLGNVLVSALNIGGAIGSTAGFAIGYTVGGPVGGAIGSTIGNIAGSFFGGLFDHHKKSVDKNTDALNALTAALYNAPSGYKVAGARYRADDGRYVYASGSSESYYRSLRGGYGGMGMAA